MSLTADLVGRIEKQARFEGLPDLSSRRNWLLGGASALASLWTTTSRAGPSGPPPFSLPRWAAGRLTFGLTEAELNLATSLGFNPYLEYHLDHATIDDSALNAMLAPLTTLAMQPYQLIPLTQGQVTNELREAAILRAVFSKRQLFERMVEFWTDHFNIDVNVSNCAYLKTIDDRDVIRANALGTFPALLSASAYSPAMLVYLDNSTSTAGNPNENYARELMELHTLGVTGGYTQQDVSEVARCFTGWTLYGSGQLPQELRWTFRFNSGQHDNGQKVVLGNVIPANGGINDGVLVLSILANHPSTAGFIARKLCKKFHGETAPQTLVDAVAATYTSTGGDIKEMLRTLFAGFDPATTPARYKRPYHQIISGLRATGATITSTSTLRSQHLTAAGQLPFNWGPPDGYPDTLEAWVGLILPRWNFGASLMNSNISGCAVDINVLLGAANTAQAVVDVIDQKMFGGGMASAEKERIRQYLLPDAPSLTKKREAVGLAIASPLFQWY